MNHNKLKAYRKLHDLDQSFLAHMLGISNVTYCRKEKGKSDFTLKEAKLLSNFFGVTIEELFFNQHVNKLFTNTV